MERILIDHYIRALRYELKKVVSQGSPKTADGVVDVVQRCRATDKLLKSSRVGRTPHVKGGLKEGGRKTSQLQTPRVWKGRIQRVDGEHGRQDQGFPPEAKTRHRGVDTDTRVCYRCGELGHIAWHCHKKKEPMQVDISNLHHCHIISVQAPRHPPHLSLVQVSRERSIYSARLREHGLPHQAITINPAAEDCRCNQGHRLCTRGHQNLPNRRCRG